MPARKPHNCSYCHTTDPSEFYRGMKSLCKGCQRNGYTSCSIPPHCAQCGERDSDNFYANRITLCKTCYNKRKTSSKYPNGVRSIQGYKPHFCLKCHTTDESKFKNSMKSMCGECYKTDRVRTIDVTIHVSEEKTNKGSSPSSEE